MGCVTQMSKLTMRVGDYQREKVLKVVWFLVCVIVVMSLLSLSGCTTISRIVDYGASANTEAVEASVFTICEGASVGSIRREFDTPEKVDVWKRLCSSEGVFTPNPER